MGSPMYDRLSLGLVSAVTRTHRAVNRWTNGRVELRLPRGGHGVWITTHGRHSGLPRRIPLLSVRDDLDPGVWIIAGSNGGQERLPGWVHNARESPDGFIEVRRVTWPVRFSEVTAGERDRCFALLCRPWPMYRSYEQQASRPVPVFRCIPIELPR